MSVSNNDQAAVPSIAGVIAARWVERIAHREGLRDVYEALHGRAERLDEFQLQNWVPVADFVPLLDAAARVLGPAELRDVARGRFAEEMTSGRYAMVARSWLAAGSETPLHVLTRLPLLWNSAFNAAGHVEVGAEGGRSIRLRMVGAPAIFRTSPGIRLMYEGVGAALLELLELEGQLRITVAPGGLSVDIWWDGAEPDLPAEASVDLGTADPPDSTDAAQQQAVIVAGRYRVRRALGKGGYGEVFEAVDEKTGRPVALKRLRGSFAPGSVGWKRFVHEARVLGQMHHPNIVMIFDLINEPPESPILVLELLDGMNLTAFMTRRGGALRTGAAVAVARALLSALGAAHALGVVHRDVKPENVFLARTPSGATQLKLLDFGLAGRADGRDDSMAGTSERVGTLAYMAPEQMLGQKPDERTDIYGVGATLYHLWTGRPPFEPRRFRKVKDLMRTVLEAEPTRPSRLRPGLEAFDRVLLQALEKSREDRYATCTEMLEALEAAASFEA